jgi:hypothetical protein
VPAARAAGSKLASSATAKKIAVVAAIVTGSTRVSSSDQKHLVQRFALAADGQSLLYSFELTDPVYLAAPLRGEMRWLYRPNVDFQLVACDPEATRSFLDN